MASTFSYAQAAKGISTPASASKSASGAATPAKEATTLASTSMAAARSWAEDVETDTLPEEAATTAESCPARSERSSSNAARVSRSVDASSVSSPDLGASSSSTVTKDDDVSSIPNTSSESTWDNKSQASTSVDKSAEPVEKTSEKVKKGKNTVVKPLLDAPVPTVNIWKLRADEQKAKVPKPAPQAATNGLSSKKLDASIAGKTFHNDSTKSKGRDDGAHGRKDARGDTDIRKSVKGRVSEKEPKQAAASLPPPPHRDQESWPTPELVVDDDRKKAQQKGDKNDKERKEGAPSGKHEWVKVPYTPSVVFNTPLPNAANTRRGGRSGGRGGAQTGSRATGSGQNGIGQPDRDGSESESALNGDVATRERPTGTSSQDASPKARRSPGDESALVTEDVSTKNVATTGIESEGPASRPSEGSQAPNHNGSYPRQYPNRSSKSRRGDFSGPSERKRDDATSPTKDYHGDDHRVSTASQTEGSGDGDRRIPTFQDGSNGHHAKQGRYNSFSGRERGRGGNRGSRASYSNGHQFSNGHASMQASSTFPVGPRSPTTFHPENNNFFSSSQSKFNRNAHRSQSVAGADAYRFPAFQNGPPAPPLQPYNMYDYGMMQPITPVPYSPYGVVQFALFSMITTQV